MIDEQRRKELFKALVRDSKYIPKKLEAFVFSEEYTMQKDGGEPDLTHLLALKLLEEILGYKLESSIIYDPEYITHIEYNFKWDKE